MLEVEPLEGLVRERPYRDVRFELGSGGAVSFDLAREQCGGLLETAVARRLQSDVPVGVLLSGGVDSSLVSLLAAAQSPRPVRTFVATFEETAFDEARYAREVSARAGSVHEEIAVTLDDPAVALARLVRAYGEPFGDDSAIPTLALFAGLKPHVRVALTGDGGDEVFAGYKDVRVFLLRARLRGLLGTGDLVPSFLVGRLVHHRHRRLRELGYGALALGTSGAELFSSLLRDGWTRRWREATMRAEAW
ncbi:MAG TPA: hypothetical protein DCQ64_15475, partial [Candidatus Rokubacteria bacterium]|nr:hypothetical protein [Candidatus Rokubacteria bacterium]